MDFSTKIFAGATTWILLTAVAWSEARISMRDRLEIRERVSQTAERIVQAELRAAGLLQADPATVHIELTFDEAKLADDEKAFNAAQKKRINDQKSSMESDTQALLQAIKSAQQGMQQQELADKKDSPKAIEPEPTKKDLIEIPKGSNGMRFGRLNIDIDRTTLSDYINREEPVPTLGNQSIVFPEFPKQVQQQAPLALTLQLPRPDFSETSFTFEPFNYITKISCEVLIPFSSPKDIEAVLSGALMKGLGLLSMAGPTAADWITVRRMQEPIVAAVKESPVDIVTSILKNLSVTLGLIASALLLGFFGLMGIRTLAKSFHKIGEDIKELKTDSDDATFEVPTEAATTTSNDQDEKSKVDDSTSEGSPIQALTSEMHTIRDQFSETVQENVDFCAEALRDLFYDQRGLGAVRDLLGFTGYKILKPAMNKLPPSCLIDLQAFIEDNRDDQANLVAGCQVAQRILVDCISRISVGSEDSKDVDRLREVLIGATDQVILEYSVKSSPQELAMILRTLTPERASRISKTMDQERLKVALGFLDKDIEGGSERMGKLLGNIDTVRGDQPKKTHRQRRFILRLARTASIEEEAAIKPLIAADDFDLKREVMTNRYFYEDLKYLPEEVMRKTLDSFPVAFRAEFLFVCDRAFKAKLLGSYKDGSKLKEMVQTELSLVEKNENRKREAADRKDRTIASFMTKIRAAIQEDPRIVESAIETQCKELGIDPPSMQGSTIHAKSAA